MDHALKRQRVYDAMRNRIIRESLQHQLMQLGFAVRIVSRLKVLRESNRDDLAGVGNSSR